MEQEPAAILACFPDIEVSLGHCVVRKEYVSHSGTLVLLKVVLVLVSDEKGKLVTPTGRILIQRV